MRTKLYTSLLAAAAVLLPSLASGQALRASYGGEVNSSLTFNLTLSLVGSILDNNGRLTVRSTTVRISQREAMKAIADREDLDLPRGARLIIHDGSEGFAPGIYIADHRSNPLYDVSDYIVYSISSSPVVTGTVSGNETSSRESTQTEFFATLSVELPDNRVRPTSVETAEGESGTTIETSGVATNRYSYNGRESRNTFRFTESSRTNVSVQGFARVGSRPAIADGRVAISGRESGTVDTDEP